MRVEGASYSVPSHWNGLQAMAHIGVADIRLECRGEHVTVAKQPRGGRAVRYRHYLSELATKPQAVRQVAPQLLEELGDPYVRLWAILADRYGERDAARVVAKIAGAIVEHGQQPVTTALEAVLAHRPAPEDRQAPIPTAVPVPAALQAYTVESGSAAAYDLLLTPESR